MERFIHGIEDGTIKELVATGGTHRYSAETVLDFKTLLRKYYRWLLGHDTARFHELTGWFEMHSEPPELRTFGLDEAQLMAKGLGSIQGVALVILFFDGGFRPGELFNVRLRDVSIKPDESGTRTYFARIRHSKTKPRTISLPLATEAVIDWVKRHPEGGRLGPEGRVQAKDPSALLVRWSYLRCGNLLRGVGRREIGEIVFPYRIRHASATFYARFLTEYQMCARYGWVMGSATVRRYVDQSGPLAHDTARKVRSVMREQTSSLPELHWDGGLAMAPGNRGSLPIPDELAKCGTRARAIVRTGVMNMHSRVGSASPHR